MGFRNGVPVRSRCWHPPPARRWLAADQGSAADQAEPLFGLVEMPDSALDAVAVVELVGAGEKAADTLGIDERAEWHGLGDSGAEHVTDECRAANSVHVFRGSFSRVM